MKYTMFHSENSTEVKFNAVSVSFCVFADDILARAALAVCAIFAAIAGAVISTSICAAIISIIIPIIIIICIIIAIICELNTALSEHRSM